MGLKFVILYILSNLKAYQKMQDVKSGSTFAGHSNVE